MKATMKTKKTTKLTKREREILARLADLLYTGTPVWRDGKVVWC